MKLSLLLAGSLLLLLLASCQTSQAAPQPQDGVTEAAPNEEDAPVADEPTGDDDNDDEDDDDDVTDQSVEEILAGGGEDSDDDDDDFEIQHAVDRQDFSEEDNDDDDDYYDDDDDTDDDGDEADVVSDDYEDDDEFEQFPYRKYEKWAKGWPQHHLFVIIIGGFRWDFLEGRTEDLTSFRYMMEHGTTVKRVKPVFPTEDFPVWTSLATGRYPEDHGITGDIMYNLKSKEFFNRSDPESRRQEDWWSDTNPFWSTASKHGKKVSLFNWHDCQLPGKALEKPTDCDPHQFIPGANPKTQATARMFDQAFTKLHKDKYNVSVVYTDIVRRAAEKFGPDSPQLLKALHDIDDIMQAKLLDIRSKKQVQNMDINLMVVSDYGVADMAVKEEIVLEDYLDLEDVQHIVYAAGYVAITPFALRHDKILLESAEMPGVDSYLTSQVQNPPIWHGVPVPDNLHYGNGEWSTDILLIAQPGYRFMTNLNDPKLVAVNGLPDDLVKGGSGYHPGPEEVLYPKMEKGQRITEEINATLRSYDEYHQFKYDMHTQAFLMGPDFKENHVVHDEIEIVDLYQILCFLLDVPPAEGHEGSWERVEDMLTVSGSNHLMGPSLWHVLAVGALTQLLLLREL